MGLVAQVGLGTGIGAGGVDEGDNGEAALGEAADGLDGLAVVFGHPDAVILGAILGEDTDAAGAAFVLQDAFGPVEGAFIAFDEGFGLHAAEDAAGVQAVFGLGGLDGFADVGIDVEGIQFAQALLDFILGEEALEVSGWVFPLGEEGEVVGHLFRAQEQFVSSDVPLRHKKGELFTRSGFGTQSWKKVSGRWG